MKKSVFARGFKAVEKEEQRREQLRKELQGKLWRVFFPKDADEDHEIPFVFLTDDPVCLYEHSVNINGKRVNKTCSGDGCCYCAEGNKPRFVGAFLGIDKTPYEIEKRDSNGNKTGKKRKVTASLRLLVRGQTDLAQLKRLKNKYGLLERVWSITKTGTGSSTKWSFDREEKEKISSKELANIIPEALQGKDFYDIIEEQLCPSDTEEIDEEDDEEVEEKVNKGVFNLNDEEEDEDEDEATYSFRRGTRNKKKVSSKKKTRRRY